VCVVRPINKTAHAKKRCRKPSQFEYGALDLCVISLFFFVCMLSHYANNNTINHKGKPHLPPPQKNPRRYDSMHPTTLPFPSGFGTQKKKH
jgi:hypothetical protein